MAVGDVLHCEFCKREFTCRHPRNVRCCLRPECQRQRKHSWRSKHDYSEENKAKRRERYAAQKAANPAAGVARHKGCPDAVAPADVKTYSSPAHDAGARGVWRCALPRTDSDDPRRAALVDQIWERIHG